MTDISVDTLVAKYVELRDRRSANKKRYEAEDAPLKELMEKLEEKFQTILNDIGANSLNTDHGNVYRTYKESVKVADWDAFISHVKEHDEWGLLERRANKTHVKELMEEARDGSYRNPPPPGVDFVRIASVQVRRKS